MDAIQATGQSTMMSQATTMLGDVAMGQGQAAASQLSMAAPRTLTQIDKAAKDFEGMFMSQMIEPMFEGIGKDSFFGGGHGEDVMKSFLISEYGKIVAQRGGYGIADSVKREMLRMQGMSENASEGNTHTNLTARAVTQTYGGKNERNADKRRFHN